MLVPPLLTGGGNLISKVNAGGNTSGEQLYYTVGASLNSSCFPAC